MKACDVLVTESNAVGEAPGFVKVSGFKVGGLVDAGTILIVV